MNFNIALSKSMMAHLASPNCGTMRPIVQNVDQDAVNKISKTADRLTHLRVMSDSACA